ncbi:MAG: ImmA/IrrE family metallo-endopeptidase [Bacteroidetes bacterium]|nr:ImmA/IrrE family metallo-endopeptidase [Bacteroidota bacterium]
MITLARQVSGLTQEELAAKLGIAQGTLSKMELGILPVSEDVIQRLARELYFPTHFYFMAGDVHVPGMKYQRARKSCPKKLLDKQDAYINIVRMHLEKLLHSVEIDSSGFHAFDASQYDTPEETARALREFWKMPAGPVRNAMNVIEGNGAAVVLCDFGSSKIDGVTVSLPKLPPVLFINKALPGDRQRHTLCHELGHEVLHSRRPPLGDEEKESNRFASEFLTPASEIRSQLTGASLATLAQLKTYWRVSMASLLYRAHELGCISDRQHIRLHKEMAPYKTREPANLDIAPERPALMSELINMHLDQLGYSLAELADMLAIKIDVLTDWYQLRREPQLSLLRPKTFKMPNRA